jgi:hypothetical protein
MSYNDSVRVDKHGNLFKDDPVYNKKGPIWIPIAEVPAINIGVWAYDRYGANHSYSKLSVDNFSDKVKKGWEWDSDNFQTGFINHPYSGSLTYLAARSYGYNYWESIPFSFAGSLWWEYLGENTRPSYSDIVLTPVGGTFIGEVLYRLSSNVLDDRTTGTERCVREVCGAILSPTRFINRLIQGKLTSVTTKEVYQKEPLDIELSAGSRLVNKGSDFGTGTQNIFINALLTYGDPFEDRDWKPFDFFRLRTDLNIGQNRRVFDELTGYGVLFGKNIQCGDLEMLTGLFQHFEYYDNKTFDLGAIDFGAGIISKYSIGKQCYLFNNLHLNVLPMGANSMHSGPTLSQNRDYNYVGGMETKLESGLELGWGSIEVDGNYYWLHTYKGEAGNNFIGIVKPRITLRIINNLNLGAEQMMYTSDRHTDHIGNYYAFRSEQRLYLMLKL